MGNSIKKDIIYTFSAQGMSMLLSFMLALFVPKILGVESFSYWQLFLFYSSYVGFFHFGLDDGVYLKYGGIDFSEINKRIISGQIILLFVFLLTIIAALLIFGSIFITDGYRWIVFISVLIDVLLANLLGYWIYLLQATCRVVNFAKIILVDRLFLLAAIILFLMIGIEDFRFYIIVYLFSKFLSLCYCFLLVRCKFQICSPFKNDVMKEYISNVKIGSSLMFANIASLLVIGISRSFIDANWGIITFGKISLMLSVVNFFVLFLSQIGVVLFPIIKKISGYARKKIYESTNVLLDVFFLGILSLYMPVVFMLNKWLPLYSDSFDYLFFLLPICVFEGKNQMLLNPYLKSLRKERLLFVVNIFSLIVSLAVSLVGVFVGELRFVLISIVIAVFFRYLASIVYLNRFFGIRKINFLMINSLYVFIFIMLNLLFDDYISFIAYLLFYIMYLLGKRKVVCFSYNQIKAYSMK